MASNLRHHPQSVDLFSKASEILGYDLLKVCLDGPFECLTRTEVSQPAILVTALAGLVKLENDNPQALKASKYTAGLSLGEYSSLVFAGSLSFEDAVKVVKVRATSMQEASEISKGGMVSVMVSGNTKLAECCNSAIEHCLSIGVANPVCQASNYLSSVFQVVGGSIEAVDYIESNAAKFGMRRVKRLPVSGAFHTKMMGIACDRLADALKTVKLSEPRVPVISNVTARPYKNVEEIRELLVRQVVSPVKWQQTMEYLFNSSSLRTVYELGPGRQLKSLINSSIDEQYRDKHIYNFIEV